MAFSIWPGIIPSRLYEKEEVNDFKNGAFDVKVKHADNYIKQI